MAGNLRGRAVGAIVEIHVDMESHTLGFSINGAAIADAGVTLPAAVRPCARMGHVGDSVLFALHGDSRPRRDHASPRHRQPEAVSLLISSSPDVATTPRFGRRPASPLSVRAAVSRDGSPVCREWRALEADRSRDRSASAAGAPPSPPPPPPPLGSRMANA